MKIPRVHQKDGRHYYIQDLEERHPLTGRPKQKWHKLTRVAAGEPAMLQALAELLGRAPQPAGSMAAHLMEFRAVHLPGLTLGVNKEYGRMYDLVADAFADFDSAEVEPGDVVKFLQDNFAATPTARRHYKARLSTFFSWCVLNSHTGVKVNPCREIKVKSPPKRKGRMTAAVFWQLHDALSPMGRCFLELAYYTRQRPTEIRLLRESAIGPERIHFLPTKTARSSGEEVDVLITPEIRACLERARSLRPKSKDEEKVVEIKHRRDPYIIQSRDGQHYSKEGLYEVWRAGVDAAGTPGVTTRDIRPFALSEMERLGFAPREIQLAAAHSQFSTTEVYLDQHRDRLSSARLPLPERAK